MPFFDDVEQEYPRTRCFFLCAAVRCLEICVPHTWLGCGLVVPTERMLDRSERALACHTLDRLHSREPLLGLLVSYR